MAAMPEEVMALMRAFGKAFNRADIDGILACVTDDFEWRLAAGPEAPHGEIVKGREAVRAALEKRDETYRDMRFSEAEVCMAGDNKVIGTFRATGRYTGGGSIDVRGVDIYVLRDGLIASKDSYWKRITDK
jgi:ketosteroid isomerase-like protein